MNRRRFLSALALAPVAAVVAPAAKPAFATGGFIKPQYGYLVGATAGESIMPLSYMSANPARMMQSVFNDAFGATDQSDQTFDEMAAYCDEIVEAVDA